MVQLSLDSGSAYWTAEALSNPPKNIEEHWAAIKNVLFSGATQAVGHVSKGTDRWTEGVEGSINHC